jgi:hypothetical protein
VFGWRANATEDEFHHHQREQPALYVNMAGPPVLH